MNMTLKAILAAAALTFAASGAVYAQNSDGVANPEMPSALECKQGYKEDMRWTRDEFDAACTKVRTNAVPSGQKK